MNLFGHRGHSSARHPFKQPSWRRRSEGVASSDHVGASAPPSPDRILGGAIPSAAVDTRMPPRRQAIFQASHRLRPLCETRRHFSYRAAADGGQAACHVAPPAGGRGVRSALSGLSDAALPALDRSPRCGLAPRGLSPGPDGAVSQGRALMALDLILSSPTCRTAKAASTSGSRTAGSSSFGRSSMPRRRRRSTAAAGWSRRRSSTAISTWTRRCRSASRASIAPARCSRASRCGASSSRC